MSMPADTPPAAPQALPLAGVSVLVVEDSRFTSEAVRLLCLRSGARLRRADSLRSARRHLANYRPNAVIADLGLPDGSGLDLIRELDAARPRISAILATSGDTDALPLATAAGADALLAKPLDSLAQFQQVLLAHLPPGERPAATCELSGETVKPDRAALREDIEHVSATIGEANEADLDYTVQFLTGVAVSAHDEALGAAVAALAAKREAAEPFRSELAALAGLLHTRLDEASAPAGPP